MPETRNAAATRATAGDNELTARAAP